MKRFMSHLLIRLPTDKFYYLLVNLVLFLTLSFSRFSCLFAWLLAKQKTGLAACKTTSKTMTFGKKHLKIVVRNLLFRKTSLQIK